MEIITNCGFTLARIASKVKPPKYSATFIVKGTFQLTPGGKAEFIEESDPPLGDLYVDNDTEKSCIHESDFALYKPRADLTLSGKCYPSDNQNIQGCRVTFQVAECKKNLYVFGDRKWIRNSTGSLIISKPQSFNEMSIIYENSFGGSNFKNNLHGKGNAPIIGENGQEFWPLPNIEDPNHLITLPDDRPDPAGFSPIGRMWPLRAKNRVGTYDEKWLKERWPYFPMDFDWGFFNCAPSDMQMNRFLTGDESLYFENLHPEIQHYHSQLPGIRARCFINKQIEEEETRFQEIELHLDTLWVDMDEEKVHLVWRGLTEVETEEMEELKHCLVVNESLEQKPKSLDDYQSLLMQRLEEEHKDVEEEEIELLPMDDSWIKEMEADFVRMEKEFAEIEIQAAESEKETRAILIAAGIDPAKLDKAQEDARNMSIKDILTQAAKQEEEIRKSNPDLVDKLPPPMTAEEINEIDLSFQFDSLPEFDAFPEPLTREDCIERLLNKESFENEDLSGLDLSDLDFSGCTCCNVNFQNTTLNNVKFTGTNLSGSNLARCDLSGIDFQSAILTNAELCEAKLSSADLRETILDDADFSGAILEKARLGKAHGFRTIFVAATLKEAQLIDSCMEEADFEGANLESVNFKNAILKEASVESANGKNINMQAADLTCLHASEGPDFTNGSFQRVQAAGSIWEDAILERADFSGAQLTDADFTNTTLTQARFTCADLTMARFEKANLTETHMTYVNLFQGSLEKTTLIRTDFRGSNLYEVEFYLAEIENAFFEGANLTMTKLATADNQNGNT